MHARENADLLHLIVFRLLQAYNLYIDYCIELFLYKPRWYVTQNARPS